MESVEDLKAEKEVLELLVNEMAAIRGGKRLDLAPEATRRERIFVAELEQVKTKLIAAGPSGGNGKRPGRRETHVPA